MTNMYQKSCLNAYGFIISNYLYKSCQLLGSNEHTQANIVSSVEFSLKVNIKKDWVKHRFRF